MRRTRRGPVPAVLQGHAGPPRRRRRGPRPDRRGPGHVPGHGRPPALTGDRRRDPDEPAVIRPATRARHATGPSQGERTTPHMRAPTPTFGAPGDDAATDKESRQPLIAL